MTRSRRALLAALCVLALALGAATLNSPVADDGGLGSEGSGGFGDAPTDDAGGSDPDNGTRDLGAIIPLRGLCIPFFTSGEFFAGLLLTLLVAGVAINRRGGPLLVLAVYAALFAPGVLLWMLVTTCGRPDLAPTEARNFSLFPGQNGTIAEGLGGGGGPGTGAPSVATSVLLVLGLAVVLVSLVLLRASGDDVDVEDPTGDPDPELDALAGLADVAGEAADRIEAGDGDVENEVYRAWREMTQFLDVPRPRATTPAEFRAAAREAGMAPGEVDALTDLFRDVRYGAAPVTADREAAALDALRAIEDAYGGDDGA